MKLSTLLSFGRDRVIQRNGQRPRMARRLWSMWRTDEQDIEKLKALAASARRLDELLKHPGWQDVLDAKAYYLASYDAQTKQVNTTAEARLIAAATWTGLEGFFKELTLRIKAGEEAYAKLKEFKRA